MPILVSMGLGLMVALVMGGRVSRLKNVVLWGEPALIAMMLIQVVLPSAASLVGAAASFLTLVAWVVTALAGMTLALINHPKPGMLLVGVGLMLNALVIGANGGMPVLVPAVALASGVSAHSISETLAHSPLHIPAGFETRLLFLGDVLPAPVPITGTLLVVSLGDVLMMVGVCALIVWAMLQADCLDESRGLTSSLVRNGKHSVGRTGVQAGPRLENGKT